MQLALEARGDMAPAVARELWDATHGNPLALVEISPLLTEDQARGRAPLDHPLPTGPRMQRVFTHQFAQLPPHTQKALLIAAASHTGSVQAVHAASRACGINDDALEPAETTGLITIRDGQIAWRHPLLRAAVYHAASGPERRAGHQALADAGAEERLEDHRAWHLAAATPQADEEVAAVLEQLADRARARGALSTATRALRQAANLTPDDDKRSRRLIAAAEAATAIGRWNEATTMIAEAQRRSPAPLLHAQATRVLASVELLRGLPDASHTRLVAAAESITDLDAALAATMMAEAVVAHMATGNWDAYFKTATRALELGRQVGGPIEAIAGLVPAPQRLVAGDTAAALELFAQYGHLASEPALWQSAPEIAAMYGLCQVWRERFDLAAPLLDAMIDFARRTGAVGSLAYPLAVNAQRHFRLGHWGAALEDALESVSLARELPGGALLATNVAYLALIEAGLGRADSVRQHCEEALALCQHLSLGATAPWAFEGWPS